MNAQSLDTVTRAIARRCRDSLPRLVGPAELEQARRCLIDSFAVAVAAAREKPVEILKHTCLPSGAGEASILATGERVSVEDAARVNGMMISLLLFDDNHMPMRGHPSAPVLPVALALGEAQSRSIHEALAAFVAGYEVECRLGMVLNPSHYETGWHATATQGVIGAAVAAGLMLDLDEDQLIAALGIAASMASGLRANFGSMTMSLHSGLAAANGIRAARLAGAGFTASTDVFGGPLGYGRVFSREWDDADFSRSVAAWGEPFLIVEPGPILKIFPCGRPTLPAVDCVMEIQQKHRVPLDEIEEIRCLVSFMYPRTLIHSRPANGLQGKTSLEYCVAATLLDDGPKLESFSDEAVARPEVARLIGLTRVEVPPELSETVDAVRRAPFDQPVTIEIGTRGGQTYRATVREHRGTPANPATTADLRHKFAGCAADTLDESRIDEIIATSHTGDAPLAGLIALLKA